MVKNLRLGGVTKKSKRYQVRGCLDQSDVAKDLFTLFPMFMVYWQPDEGVDCQFHGHRIRSGDRYTLMSASSLPK